jgi:hypothetical protein
MKKFFLALAFVLFTLFAFAQKNSIEILQIDKALQGI